MFENVNSWKATGMLGGAMAGMSAPYELAQAEAQRRLREMEIENALLAQEEARKAIPLKDLERDVAMRQKGEELAAWDSGEAGKLASTTRQVGIASNETKLNTAKLEQARAKAEWHMMAADFVESANPADLAGEKWTALRDAGRDLGLPIPDQYSPDVAARLKAAREVAVRTLPMVQKQLEQAAMFKHQSQMQAGQQAHTASLQDQQLRSREREGAADRESRQTQTRMTSEATLEAARIRAAQAGEKPTSTDQETADVLKKARDQGVQSLNPVEASIVFSFLQKRSSPRLQEQFQIKLKALQAASGDPKAQEKARRELNALMVETAAEQMGPLGIELVKRMEGAVSAPQSTTDKNSRYEQTLPDNVPDRTTAEDEETGKKYIRQNGKWVPL